MPVNVADVSTFTDPIVIPADSDPADRTYIITLAQGLANRTRWLADRLGGILGTGEWSYVAPRTKHFTVELASAQPVTDSAGATPQWRRATQPLTAGQLVALANDGEIVVPIGALLRDGMVITDVIASCKPAAVRAGTSRVRFALCYWVPDFTTPANNPVTPQIVGAAFVYDDGTTNNQNVSLSSLLGGGHTVVRSSPTAARDYFVHIRSGSSGSVGDIVHGIKLVVSDPGPRNV